MLSISVQMLIVALFSANAISEGSLSSPASVSIEECLQVLKKTTDDDATIRKFFYENVLQKENEYPLHNLFSPSNCVELFHAGFKKSGVYSINIKPWIKGAKQIQVYCDMETDGGGWMVFQRRGEYPDRQINFTRDWKSYKNGFGNLQEEFWLGNDNLHALTTQDRVVLRVDMEGFEEQRVYAEYSELQVASADESYVLNLGNYTGTAGDSMTSAHNGQRFATYDYDKNECVSKFKGGWWYSSCHAANLNGLYLRGKHESYADGVEWSSWRGQHYSLKWTEMKIRPASFHPR